jgi:hypothetical protein
MDWFKMIPLLADLVRWPWLDQLTAADRPDVREPFAIAVAIALHKFLARLLLQQAILQCLSCHQVELGSVSDGHVSHFQGWHGPCLKSSATVCEPSIMKRAFLSSEHLPVLACFDASFAGSVLPGPRKTIAYHAPCGVGDAWWLMVFYGASFGIAAVRMRQCQDAALCNAVRIRGHGATRI